MHNLEVQILPKSPKRHIFKKTIQQWCDSARVPLWCCTCWCPIKKSWSQLSSSSNLSHRQDHYKHRGCWQNLVPKASAGKTHLISQRFLASQLGIVGQSIGRPVGILRIKSMIQVILTVFAPRLSGFTVSPCSGISALREDWLLVGTVERNKQKYGSFKSHVALETTNLRYTMWLIGTFPRERSHDLLPSVAIHRLAPSHRKLSGSSGSCRWPRHLLTSWKKKHLGWTNDEPIQNGNFFRHLLMIFAMRIYDTFLYISKDLLWFASAKD